jgi:hypothetical protein
MPEVKVMSLLQDAATIRPSRSRFMDWEKRGVHEWFAYCYIYSLLLYCDKSSYFIINQKQVDVLND